MEISELSPLQNVAHVGGLLLAGQGILPHIHFAAPAHSQHAPLADVTPGGRTGAEVGMQRLVGTQIPDSHLPICPCCDHVVAGVVCCYRQDWTLQSADAVDRCSVGQQGVN